MKEIVYLKRAEKDLDALELSVAERIVEKIENYANGQNVDIIKLVNRDEFRLRIGNYRVLLILKQDEIEIQRILHRKEIYKKG